MHIDVTHAAEKGSYSRLINTICTCLDITWKEAETAIPPLVWYRPKYTKTAIINGISATITADRRKGYKVTYTRTF